MFNSHKAKIIFFSLQIILVILLIITSILQGPANIPFSHIASIFKNYILKNNQTSFPLWQADIILNVRLPRLIIASCAGASLALCGVIMQSIFRNPLASPSIIGVSSGASLGAVLAIYGGFSIISTWSIPFFAFVGASISLFIVYKISLTRGETNIATLLLSGVAISALNISAMSLLLALSLNNWDVARMIIYWTMGGLDGRTWDHVLMILPIVTSSFCFLLFYSKPLNVILLGEQHALSVGIDVTRTRRNLLIISSAMTAAAVSVVGGIGFIGLVVPHILRLLLGPSHRYLLPASLLGGAITLLGADLFVHTLFADKAIPLGVITATLGAPFFLFLLVKQRTALH
ncbi:MAG: iron chelate uptake ABC transporter family permease subunit [Psychromonas sp.]|nr:iron chelate uptake ABC transporter family permease subunit [Psychromonas sp.]